MDEPPSVYLGNQSEIPNISGRIGEVHLPEMIDFIYDCDHSFDRRISPACAFDFFIDEHGGTGVTIVLVVIKFPTPCIDMQHVWIPIGIVVVERFSRWHEGNGRLFPPGQKRFDKPNRRYRIQIRTDVRHNGFHRSKYKASAPKSQAKILGSRPGLEPNNKPCYDPSICRYANTHLSPTGITMYLIVAITNKLFFLRREITNDI